MDIQDNLLVKKWNPVLKKWNSFEILLDNVFELVLFEFNEYEKVVIKNNSKNLIFRFESAFSENYVILNPGEEEILSEFEYDRADDEYKHYYPEKYMIEIEYVNNRVETAYFLVNSNALGENTDNIRKIVSDFSKGLELDLKNSIKGKFYKDTNQGLYLPLYEKVLNNEKKLHVELDYILKNPIESIEKKLSYTNKPSKISKKKIMKDIKKSHSNNFKKKQYYEKKIITYNNSANIVLKKSIRRIINTCNDLDEYFNINLIYISKNIEKNQILFNKSEQEYLACDSKKMDLKYFNTIKSEYLNQKDILTSLKNDFINLNEKKLKIKKIKNGLLNILNETWISNIDDDFRIINSIQANTNKHYRNVINFSKVINADYEDNYSKNGLYHYKKTHELYEYYVLILLMRILIEEGFHFEINEQYDFNLLFENGIYMFKNGVISIKIVYNKIVKRTDDKPRDEIVNQNSSSNKPDILIMIYENNKLVNSVILEVKCRKKCNIYNDSFDTKVFSQLKDYTNFWYFDHDLNLKKDVINMVYCIYPDKKSKKDFYNADQICLLSLEPEYDYKNTLSYREFYNEIIKYIPNKVFM